MTITQSSNGKQVTLSELTDTLGTPTKIEISKGYNTVAFIQLPYVSGNTYTMDVNTVGIEAFFDSSDIWIDDIYELKITYVTKTVSTKFLTYYNTTKKVYNIEGKIPYDVKFGYQFDKNIQYGSYAYLLYKSLLIAAVQNLWERANYILTAINKLNDNYVYR